MKASEFDRKLGVLSEWVELAVDPALMELNPDALDAAICVLAAQDFLLDAAMQPPNTSNAEKEGWIWLRRPERGGSV